MEESMKKKSKKKFIYIDSTKIKLNSGEEYDYLMPIVDGLFGINNPDNNRYYISVNVDGKGNVLTKLNKGKKKIFSL